MVGTLDHPEDWPPTWEHSGIESKVPWFEISDDLPQTTTEESGFLKNARDRMTKKLEPGGEVARRPVGNGGLGRNAQRTV